MVYFTQSMWDGTIKMNREKSEGGKKVTFLFGTMSVSGLLLIFVLSLSPFSAQNFRDTLKSFCI